MINRFFFLSSLLLLLLLLEAKHSVSRREGDRQMGGETQDRQENSGNMPCLVTWLGPRQRLGTTLPRSESRAEISLGFGRDIVHERCSQGLVTGGAMVKGRLYER